MTIEEKAEEYVSQFYGKKSLFSFPGLEQAYIAGAKENGVVWHDLRKDPKDLPPLYKRVITQLIDGERYINELGRKGCWLLSNDVVAWCEIPKFKEVKNESD